MGRRGRAATTPSLGDIVKAGSDAENRKAAFQGYFETMEDNIVLKWMQTKTEDVDAREELWRQYHVLSELQRAMDLDIKHGKQAKKKLEDSK